jgi:hypothetical protein
VESPDEALLRESGERLAISMTVSVLLREVVGSDDRRLAALHTLLSDLVEAQLAQVPEDGSMGSEAARGMFSHATATVDRIFRMARKLEP